MKFIPSKLYKQIVESVIILCVDVVVEYKGKFLLVKRKDEPLKGWWWVLGGRAYKGEKTLDAAKRKVKQEIGLTGYDFKYLGVYEDSYKKSAWGVPTSSVSTVYWCRVKSLEGIKLDQTSSDFKLSDNLPKRFITKLKLKNHF